jgi:hypothetical protein
MLHPTRKVEMLEQSKVRKETVILRNIGNTAIGRVEAGNPTTTDRRPRTRASRYPRGIPPSAIRSVATDALAIETPQASLA